MVVLLCKVEPQNLLRTGAYPELIPTQSPEVSKYDLTSLRLIMCGAAPLSAELINQLSARLPWTSIGQGYGTHLIYGWHSGELIGVWRHDGGGGLCVFPTARAEDLHAGQRGAAPARDDRTRREAGWFARQVQRARPVGHQE